jgi:hypothetical protein
MPFLTLKSFAVATLRFPIHESVILNYLYIIKLRI